MSDSIKKVNVIGLGALGMLFGTPIADYLNHPSAEKCPNPPSAKQTDAIYSELAVAQERSCSGLRYVMDHEHLARHRKDTYVINGEVIHPILISPEEAAAEGPADLVILAVKYPALEAALNTMESSVGENTILLSLMNGVDSEEVLAERFGADKVLYAIAQGMDAQRYGTDLKFSVRGQINLGVPKDSPYSIELKKKLNLVCRLLAASGIKYVVEEDIVRRIWCKFMLNVGINQTCMVYDAAFGDAMVPGSEEFAVFVSAMREVCLVAQAKGIDVGEKDVAEYIEILGTLSPTASPSMGQDRKAKRRSEVDMFGGTMMRLGRELGIPTPVNEYLVRRAREIEAAY